MNADGDQRPNPYLATKEPQSRSRLCRPVLRDSTALTSSLDIFGTYSQCICKLYTGASDANADQAMFYGKKLRPRWHGWILCQSSELSQPWRIFNSQDFSASENVLYFMPPFFSEVTHVICHSIHGIVMVDLTLLLILTGCKQSQADKTLLRANEIQFPYPLRLLALAP